MEEFGDYKKKPNDYPREYLKTIKDKFNYEEFSKKLDYSKNLKALIIGDSIIDQYVFVSPKGRAVKDPILSAQFKEEESYAGGTLAIANHLSSYINRIKLVTLIGDQNSKLDFINNSLSKNSELEYFIKENSPTTIKRRYIDGYRNNKLFKVEYINDQPISEKLSKEIVDYLSGELPKQDIVIVSDFGHGFINNSIRKVLEEKSSFLSANIQSNSSNLGYNYINHYKNLDFIVMNEDELRLPLMMRFEDINETMFKFYEKFKFEKFLVTMGKGGCLFFNKGEIYGGPALIKKVVDTVGSGDAVFSIVSPFAYLNVDNEMVPFIANCAGAIKSEYMGNKEKVSKDKLIKFIKEIYDGMERI